MKSDKINKIISLMLALALLFVAVPTANAAALASLSDTMTRIKVSQTSNHDMRFQVITAMSSGTFTINFNTAGFNAGSVDYTDIDLRYGSSSAQVYGTCASSCTEAPLAAAAGATNTWGAVFATNTVTFSYPTGGQVAIAANDFVRIEIGDNAAFGVTGNAWITNPGTSGSKSLAITFPADSGTIAVPIATEDQVVISATVDPNITFQISSNSASLGTMITGAVATASDITLTMGTNAVSGYVVTILDEGSGASDGLYKSSAPTRLIDSATATLAGGTEGYGVKAITGTGSPTISAPYSTAGAEDVGALQRTAQSLVTYSGPTGATNQTATLRVKAAISASTPAGSYADTLTLIMTGTF
ncbi:MAG: hypothetical protein WCI63_02185 [bacterium]